MSLFDKQICEIRRIINNQNATRHTASPQTHWPPGGERNFVLRQDTAVELGNPSTESTSFSLWFDQQESSPDDSIVILGPALDESVGKSIPFGQIAILGLKKEDQKNDYQLFRELEEVKYHINLKGYMRRGVSQFLREWSRIGIEAINRGFSLQTLGNELIRQYRRLEYVTSVELLMITDEKLLSEIKPAAMQVLRIIEAMNKMLNESMLDCENCDYVDICREVEGLKILRKQKVKNITNSLK